jgi:NAD-specific glutamate dehydrogenase
MTFHRSSIIHIHKSVFEQFDKQLKNCLLKGTNPSIMSHYNARISCVQVELVDYEKEFMHGLFNTMVEEGNYNKKTYNKKKIDTLREKVREICAMVVLNEDSNEEDKVPHLLSRMIHYLYIVSWLLVC